MSSTSKHLPLPAGRLPLGGPGRDGRPCPPHGERADCQRHRGPLVLPPRGCRRVAAFVMVSVLVSGVAGAPGPETESPGAQSVRGGGGGGRPGPIRAPGPGGRGRAPGRGDCPGRLHRAPGAERRPAGLCNSPAPGLGRARAGAGWSQPLSGPASELVLSQFLASTGTCDRHCHPPHPRVSTPGSISVSEGWPLPMGPQVAVDLSRENPDWVHKCAGGPCPTNVLLCECVLRIMGYLHPWMWLSQHALTVPLLTLTPVHCPPYPCLHTLPSQTGMLTCV